MSDTEYNTTIERKGSEDGEPVTWEIPYTSDPVPIDKSIDVSLELAEISSSIANLSDPSMAGSAFASVARAVLTKGGHKYVLKMFKICKVRRSGDPVTDIGAFKLAYDGKGGLLECTKALQWVLEVNFGDFFTELLGSFGQPSPDQE